METRQLICTGNQWTGFYMIGTSTSVVKELMNRTDLARCIVRYWTNLYELVATLLTTTRKLLRHKDTKCQPG